MTPKDNADKHRALADIVYQFSLGIAFGLVLAMLPALLISWSVLEWCTLYLAILGGGVLLCGVLSAILGKQFLAPLINVLESMPPIA
ncbi:MAG: hypothetical protein AAFO87_08250 [Cyanobacteria bacterium J06607_6]